MDRLNQIRGEAGSSRDLTLDSSLPSESFLTANESSSKYFSLSEVDSTFSISPSKDSLSVTTTDPERTINPDGELISNLSPIPIKSDIDYKIGKQIEAANILSGGVNIFDDNDNSYDGDELVIDDNAVDDEKVSCEVKLDENKGHSIEKPEILETLDDADTIPSKDTEVVLQIDGKNVDAIDIGNGLYLYRKAGEEELAAVQIIDDDQQQPSFKFLKVRENAEGNLEVYEEIEIEIPKEVPIKEGNPAEKTSHVPVKDISKVINEPSNNKIVDKITKTPKNETNIVCDLGSEPNIDIQSESKTEVNFNGKMMKLNESRKSPLVGTYTPMTYHSTPNKEGIPLTKTMVDQQLHPSRHSDNVKKTIEVHTDSCRQKLLDTPPKNKDLNETSKTPEAISCEQDKPESVTDSLFDLPNTGSQKQSITETTQNTSDAVTDCESMIEENCIVEENCASNIEVADNPKSFFETKDENIIKASVSTPIQLRELDKIELSHTSSEKGQTIIISQVEKEKSDIVALNVDVNQDIEKSRDNITKNETNDITINKEKAAVKMNDIGNEEKTNKDEPFEENLFSSDTTINLNNKKLYEDKIENNVHKEPKINNLTCSNEINKTSNESDQQDTKKKSVVKNLTENEKPDKINVEDFFSKIEGIEQSGNEFNINCIVTHKSNETEQNNKETTMNTSTPNKDKSCTVNENILEDNTHLEIIQTLQQPKNTSFKDKDISSLEIYSKTSKVDIEKKIHLKDEQNISTKNEVRIVNYVGETVSRENNKVSSTKVIPENVSHVKDIRQPIMTNFSKLKSDIMYPKLTATETNAANIIQNMNKLVFPKMTLDKIIKQTKVELPLQKIITAQPINNNEDEVPFGKWTEVNRQDFLNRIKEIKIPTNSSNKKQLKQPHDLNRRDVLKKIDSQRQSAAGSTKIVDIGPISKLNSKIETSAFINKCNVKEQANKNDIKTSSLKVQSSFVTQKPIDHKKGQKDESTDSVAPTNKLIHRKEINNQDLIDKTIEGIINRAVTGKNTPELAEEKTKNVSEINTYSSSVSLDDIEMKMNELHGIPFEERSAHEMSKIAINDIKNYSKTDNFKSSKIPNLVPFKSKDQKKDKLPDSLSDEEIIEHEPITGDIETHKQSLMSLLSSNEKAPNEPIKEAIITEKDFDKFARRNSFTYENCLTVNFDNKDGSNVLQTIVEKDPPVKKLSRNELMLAESKAKSVSKQHAAMRHNNHSSKIPTSLKVANNEDTFNKNYQSRVQIAYQSVLTAKRNLECPITIIEDKPVKVLYMDTNMEYTPMQLNFQGQELSPSKKQNSELCDAVQSASESLDSDTILDSNNEVKPQDETKAKSKHQRKQVLTPVEEPEIELIEPGDLGIEISPKKKRKLEDKNLKVSRNLVPKKSYLLNRNIIDEEIPKPHESVKNTINDTENRNEIFKGHSDAISAIDNLVKAAELIETQSENKNTTVDVQSLDNSQNTPIKRGRGRPRKYPIPDQGSDVKVPSPQKKPRLIDAKVTKSYTDSDESSDGEIVKENWTMGKINEKIVCPICHKLFRSENVVFKHVKHCTGPSPNRSDSDKRSPVRLRRSSERKSHGSGTDYTDDDKDQQDEDKIRSRKSRHYSKFTNDNDDVIIIEDRPIKEKSEKSQNTNLPDTKKNITKSKAYYNTSNLICEFCGKTFRQLSYLVNHKLQHKKENAKNSENELAKSVFSCEVCKKEFRKLHHLVQHRIIHNSNTMATRLVRKGSSEQNDAKSFKNQNDLKRSDDPSAGFRCEPCDKSFRKLHHLVEHRETHDGINKKGTSNTQNLNEVKPSVSYNCDKCKEIFKKLQDYLEHKEQHLETSSEKSDDKSVKSSLSTKDIIHECSLCYMVFPNEHSLNKHTIICLRKKKQSAAKQAAKKTEEKESIEGDDHKSDETILHDTEPNTHCQQIDKIDVPLKQLKDSIISSQQKDENDQLDNPENLSSTDTAEEIDTKDVKIESSSNDKDVSPENTFIDQPNKIKIDNKDGLEQKIKLDKNIVKESIKTSDSHILKKKLPIKEKITPTITKRYKSAKFLQSVVEKTKSKVEASDDDDEIGEKTKSKVELSGDDEIREKTKSKVESNDDDEIRYMLNPNFKEDSSEAKLFMKVRAQKRSSLQIERPNSKDLVKRRISLQHPPKIPRLRAKAVEPRPLNSLTVAKRLKLSKPNLIPVTDSDDSDVKYSFPVSPSEATTSKDDNKSKRQSLATKRKSLTGIAKRKSTGKHKPATPKNKIKRRTTEVEHRCDCGQLFSSAALLSRHTTLAHTPPRIRRRRSPPPEIDTPASTKSLTNKTKPTVQTKKPRSDGTNSNTIPNIKVGTRKSSVNNSEAKVTSDVVKTMNAPIGKVLRSAAHRGVPVPEKMRKVMEKPKK